MQHATSIEQLSSLSINIIHVSQSDYMFQGQWPGNVHGTLGVLASDCAVSMEMTGMLASGCHECAVYVKLGMLTSGCHECAVYMKLGMLTSG